MSAEMLNELRRQLGIPEGAQQLMSHGVNGLVAPLEDPRALVREILTFFELSVAERQMLAKGGLTLVAENYSESRRVSQYLELYRTLQK